MAQITLTDFSGGKNAGSPERLSQNEASDLRNLIHTDGCLVSLNGRTRLNATAIAASAVNGLYRWYKSGHRVNNTASTSQKGWLIASCGSDIHLWTGSAFVPLMRTTNVTTRPGFSSANGRCYMARNGLHRFDGFYYNVGTVTVSGGALTTVNADAGLDIDWSYVTPGCDIFIKNGGAWEGPFVITSCTSTALTLTSNASVVTNAEYIIRRSNDVGIDSPGAKPTISVSASTSSLDAGGHKYKWVLVSSAGESLISGESASVTTVAGESINISVNFSPPLLNASYSIRIYRNKVAVPGTFYRLTTVSLPTGLLIGNKFIYHDTVADSSLGVAYNVSNNDAGITYTPATVPIVTIVASSSGLAAGSYRYVSTLYNSLTGVESNRSEPSDIATPDGSQSVTVTAATSDLTLIDRQADYVRFYRTYNGQTGDDALYYRLAQVPWAGGATSVAYVDSSVADVDLGVQLAPEDNNPPPAGVNNCYYHNGKLYLWGTSENPNRLYFSTTGEPEYYPPYEFGVHDDIAMENYTLGGYVDFGDTGNEILGVISDSGPITDSNSIAAPLLVVTRSRLYHWYGSDWRDFRRVEIGHDMTACRDLCNWKGVITRISKAGPTLKPPGNIVWQDAYQKLFPQATLPFSEQVTAGGGTTDYFDLSCATVWRDRLVFTWCQTTSTSPNRMAMLHLPTGTYTEIGTTDVPVSCYSLSVWDGPGDNGELYYGDNAGVVWRLDAKTSTNTYWTPATTTGVATVYKSGLITIDNKDAYNSKRGIRLTLRYRKPSVDQSITVKFYNDGNSTAQDTVTKTLSSSDAAGRLTIDLGPPGIATKGIQFEITGTFTVPVFLEGWKLEYESSGRNAH